MKNFISKLTIFIIIQIVSQSISAEIDSTSQIDMIRKAYEPLFANIRSRKAEFDNKVEETIKKTIQIRKVCVKELTKIVISSFHNNSTFFAEPKLESTSSKYSEILGRTNKFYKGMLKWGMKNVDPILKTGKLCTKGIRKCDPKKKYSYIKSMLEFVNNSFHNQKYDKMLGADIFEPTISSSIERFISTLNVSSDNCHVT